MFYGSDCLIYKPPPQDTEEIVEDMKRLKKKNILEQSFDDSDEEPKD